MIFFNKDAPEIVGIKDWINSKPLTLADLKDKIILLDFWTYSCINCIRTLPGLKAMWEKYRGKDVMIIGIHTPEFDFEKELANVKSAVKKHRIEYPVANDPERLNWERYGNTYWPRAALISDGKIILEHIGESGYDEIDNKINSELVKKGKSVNEVITEPKKSYHLDMSPETYAGSSRSNGLGSGIACTKDGCNEYIDAGEHIRDVIYPSGRWNQENEYLEAANEGYLAYTFYAKEVNIVMDGKGKSEVLLDDKPVPKDKAGKDIVFEKGKSFVNVTNPDMYNLISSEEYIDAEIKVKGFKGLKVYAYTFG